MDFNSTYYTVSGLTLLRPLTVFFIKKFLKSVEILTLFFLGFLDRGEKIKKINENKISIFEKWKSRNYICAGISTLYKISLITINGVYQMKKENNNNGYQEFECEHTGSTYIIDNQDYNNKSISIADISNLWTKCYGEVIEEKESGFIQELVKLVKEVK